MLKGKSTIQLFDAATGAKLLEQSDTNMVTNALETIANLRDRFGIMKWWKEPRNNSDGMSISSTASPFFNMMPLYQCALGGILLWDENIEEDPSIVIPPAGVNEVGHAGNSYNSTDIYRGRYNENESGYITNGYRHVWDFDTDKANGTIKCLSLTSWHGGNIGCHGSFSGDLYPRYNHFYFHSANQYIVTSSSSHGISIREQAGGTVIYMRKMEDGTLRMYKKNGTSAWYLKLPDPLKLGLSTTGMTYTDRVELPISLTSQYASFYVYKGQIHEIAMLTETRLQHRIFDLEGGQISSKTLDIPLTISKSRYNPAVFRGGYYYILLSNAEIVKVNEQGEEVSRIAFPNATTSIGVRSVTVNDFNDEITFGIRDDASGDGAYYTHILNTRDTVGALSRQSYACLIHWASSSDPFAQYVATDDPKSPFVYFFDPSNSTLVPMVNTGYLATINNLKSPITKTSAQTMKITYEIYDE